MPLPPPASVTLRVTPTTKFAVTVWSLFMRTEHAEPFPLHAPPQLEKKSPESPFALIPTVVPLKNFVVQVLPQAIVPFCGLDGTPPSEVTEPVPAPAFVTVSVKVGTTVFVCCAELLARAKSGSVPDTLMELVIICATVGVTTMVMVAS